jgi:ribosomal protein S18 acetylase RimI-like enzyme
MTPAWTLEDRMPTPAEHRRIAQTVGWGETFDWASHPASLAGSTLGVVAVADAVTVGMGRVVGDGVMYFYIQDVAVDPEYQGRGIGRAILDRLLDLIADRAPAPAFVALFATPAGEPLYRGAGFTPGDMTGLFQIVKPSGRG